MADTVPFGFLNINKALGVTSHTVVAQARRGLKVKKVGHAGTLDPLATGVLVLCLGPATRLSEYAMSSQKRYRARVRLGVETTTYDAEGDVVSERDPSAVRREDVAGMLPQFTGDIAQLPPLYSAIKKDGRKLYEIARAGESVEREARQVTVSVLEIVEWSPPEFVLDVTCGAGTYIRSLAYDIGAALGVGAHLSGLTRTRSGVFALEDAIALDDVLPDPEWQRHLLPPDVTLQQYPARHLNDSELDDVLHGRAIPRGSTPAGELARAYAPDGRFVALLRPITGPGDTGLWRPHKVFST